jgi:hypothetical protein
LVPVWFSQSWANFAIQKKLTAKNATLKQRGQANAKTSYFLGILRVLRGEELTQYRFTMEFEKTIELHNLHLDAYKGGMYKYSHYWWIVGFKNRFHFANNQAKVSRDLKPLEIPWGGFERRRLPIIAGF